MKEIDLSIVIPCYNVEKYIKECIESVLEQNIYSYEILLINDGSTDKTLNILELYSSNPKIKIINQQNGGLSKARNTGLLNAKGEYVLFLDSDDFVEKNSLNKVLKLVKEKSLNILAFNFFIYYKSSNFYCEKRKRIKKNIFSGEEFLKFNLSNKNYPMSWLNIYNKEFLIKNNLFFKEGILHEDVEFYIRLLKKVERMIYVDIPVIYYRQRNGSITKKKNKRRESYLEILKTYNKEIKDIKDNELKQLIYNYMGYFCKNIILECIMDKNIKFLKKNSEEILRILNNTNKLKYKILKVIMLIL